MTRTKRTKLDRIDKRILHDLQENGRMTNVELAEQVGISAPPRLRRLRTLEKAGYIDGYFARINNVSMGYTIRVFAMVKLESQSETVLTAFEQRAAEWPMVRECHMLAGDNDFLLKIVAKDWDDYQNFLTSQLTAAPHVIAVKSSMCLRSHKELPGVPIVVE